MKQHSMACEFPEGCSCGASEWNAMEELCRIYFEIAAECIGEDEVRKRRDARIANSGPASPATAAQGKEVQP